MLTSAEDRERFWSASKEEEEEETHWLRGMQAAPALVICCSDREAYLERYAAPDKGWTDRSESRWPVPYWDIDTGMAALLMLLTATDNGLAGLFFGWRRSVMTRCTRSSGSRGAHDHRHGGARGEVPGPRARR